MRAAQGRRRKANSAQKGENGTGRQSNTEIKAGEENQTTRTTPKCTTSSCRPTTPTRPHLISSTHCTTVHHNTSPFSKHKHTLKHPSTRRSTLFNAARLRTLLPSNIYTHAVRNQPRRANAMQRIEPHRPTTLTPTFLLPYAHQIYFAASFRRRRLQKTNKRANEPTNVVVVVVVVRSFVRSFVRFLAAERFAGIRFPHSAFCGKKSFLLQILPPRGLI